MNIEGKRAVVIGGASGMGRATAERLAAQGAKVAVLDRESSAGAEVAKSFGASFHPVEVTDFEGTEQALAAAVEGLGGLHITVTTAGGGIAQKTFGSKGPHDLDDFRGVVDLNLIATFNISRL